jgi:hypothetical protein
MVSNANHVRDANQAHDGDASLTQSENLHLPCKTILHIAIYKYIYIYTNQENGVNTQHKLPFAKKGVLLAAHLNCLQQISAIIDHMQLHL